MHPFRFVAAILLSLLSLEAFQQRTRKQSLQRPVSFKHTLQRYQEKTTNIGREPLTVLRNNEDDRPILVELTDDSDDGIDKDEILKLVEANQPSQWMIMKELLGLNVFTLILALLIAFFMGSNMILGPGWLGSRLGIEGTGTFNEISDSIPDVIDLSKADYLL